jgi:hypothetical protein
MIDMSKKYRTRAGREVRIYAVDAGGEYPIHGATLEMDTVAKWEPEEWTPCGKCYLEGPQSLHDLVEAKAEVWVWQHASGAFSEVARDTKERCCGLFAGRKGQAVRFVQEDEA